MLVRFVAVDKGVKSDENSYMPVNQAALDTNAATTCSSNTNDQSAINSVVCIEETSEVLKYDMQSPALIHFSKGSDMVMARKFLPGSESVMQCYAKLKGQFAKDSSGVTTKESSRLMATLSEILQESEGGKGCQLEQLLRNLPYDTLDSCVLKV